MTKGINIGDIIFLNLDEVDLFGTEGRKRVSKVAQYVRDIEKGDNFPPVFVVKVDDNKYLLSGYKFYSKTNTGDRDYKKLNYGGHYRALAHYIAGIPLKCMITEDC